MHRVKRAVIMAAGRGERLRPLTDSLPKPLIPVGGTPMIVSILEALRRNGIGEIYAVTGYRKEAFEPLRDRYPELTLIWNPDYAVCNNISSLYAAREHLSEAMILDGDQIIRNPEALCPEFSRSGYNAVWTDEPTREWVLTLEGERVTACSRTGAPRGSCCKRHIPAGSNQPRFFLFHCHLHRLEQAVLRIHIDHAAALSDSFDLAVRRQRCSVADTYLYRLCFLSVCGKRRFLHTVTDISSYAAAGAGIKRRSAAAVRFRC